MNHANAIELLVHKNFINFAKHLFAVKAKCL